MKRKKDLNFNKIIRININIPNKYYGIKGSK